MLICFNSYAENTNPEASIIKPNPTPTYHLLTEEEKALLDRGEISTAQYVAGGMVGTVLGLGIGNAIQGTYMPTGLIFTLGEVGAIGVMVAGAVNCIDTVSSSSSYTSCAGGALLVGYLALLGLRIWEVIDVWSTPASINNRIQGIRERNGIPRPSAMILPAIDQIGSINGGQIALKFNF